MEYILRVLDLLNSLQEYFNIEYDVSNKYADIIKVLNINSKEEIIVLNRDIRVKIEEFLKSIKVQKEKILIAKYLGYDVENISENDVVKLGLFMLSDTDLLKYLVLVLRTISYVQKGNLLLLKYSKNIWNTGWHNLAKQCRGKVIDLESREIVVYPFDKFFNLNEVEETNLERIEDLLNKANKVYVTDKKDGSAIIVTKYKGDLIINTNGEFENIQIELAKKLFEQKYLYFYQNVPEGFTFVFELIHPENRIVLDYGSEKKLYLLAIRDLTTLKLKSYEELEDFSNEYKLDITESFSFETLSYFMNKAQLETKDIKEGWVFRIITDNEDIMFKLKYTEYFNLARLKNIPSLKKVYTLLVSGTLDDALSVVDSDIKDSVMKDISVIYDYIEKFKELIVEDVKGIKNKYTLEDVIDNSQILNIMNDLKDNVFITYILKVLKGNRNIDECFEVLPKPSIFERLYKETNKRLNITEDNWEVKRL